MAKNTQSLPPCPGKGWYPTKKDAKAGAKVHGKRYHKEYYWYYCDEHQCWHLTTHSKEWVREFNRKKETILRQMDKSSK